MEYEKENGDYLEFEVYPERIEIYQIINKIEHNKTLKGNDYTNSLKADSIRLSEITNLKD